MRNTAKDTKSRKARSAPRKKCLETELKNNLANDNNPQISSFVLIIVFISAVHFKLKFWSHLLYICHTPLWQVVTLILEPDFLLYFMGVGCRGPVFTHLRIELTADLKCVP